MEDLVHITPVSDARLCSLREAVDNLRAGHFDIRLPASVAGDDIDTLSDSVMRLAASLSEQSRSRALAATLVDRAQSVFRLEDLLEQIWQTLAPVLPLDHMLLALRSDTDGVERVSWVKSRTEPAFSLGTPLPGGFSTVVNRPAVQRIDPMRAGVTAGPFRSMLVCRLHVKERTLGTLLLLAVGQDAYNDSAVRYVEDLTGFLSRMVERALIYRRVEELNALRDRFLGMAVHDLRNPLASIDGFVKLLLGGILGELSGRQQAALERVQQACEDMLHLINDLLDINAVQTGRLTLRLEEVDVGAILRKAAESAQLLAAPKSITVELDAPPLPGISADANRLYQILDNLLSNACKFSNPGTAVRLGASCDDEAVEIYVEDHGVGIPAHEVDKLFSAGVRPSVRPTRGERSNGLGLQIVKRLVDAHNGTIRVESSPGQGSRFTVRLPRAGPAGAA